MSEHDRPPGASTGSTHPVRGFVAHSASIHTGLGLLGNTAFLVGSVLFLWESTTLTGVWLFIGGAAGMLAGSIGRAIVEARTDD